MDSIKMKTESLPQRCEVCHQTDMFDPQTNHCERCQDIPIAKPQHYLKWWAYLLLELCALPVSFLGIVLWPINFITYLFLYIGSLPLKLIGYNIPWLGSESILSIMVISALWPLLLSPLHWLNFRVLKWKFMRFLLLFLLSGIIISLVSQGFFERR
jgi:hypothetical protein